MFESDCERSTNNPELVEKVTEIIQTQHDAMEEAAGKLHEAMEILSKFSGQYIDMPIFEHSFATVANAAKNLDKLINDNDLMLVLVSDSGKTFPEMVTDGRFGDQISQGK